jgi:hypothetical protein
MRVAKLILVVEPGTGRTSKLVPIQQLGMGAGLHTLWLEAKDRRVAVLGLDERWLPLETKIKIPNIQLHAYS